MSITAIQPSIYTDGGCSPNPGPGAWGYVVVRGDEILHQDWGGNLQTTNNRMELMGLIQALRYVLQHPTQETYTIFMDSNLCVQTYNTWMAGWEARGWRRKTGAVENLDLIQELAQLKRQDPAVEVMWVKAHAGIKWNDYVDQLVQDARAQLLQESASR